MLKRIVVGVDGSEASRRALEWTVGRAVETGAEVVAVHVVRQFGEFVLDVPGIGLDDWRQHFAWELRAVWAKPLTAAGVRHRCRTVEGEPAATLAAVAEAEQ